MAKSKVIETEDWFCQIEKSGRGEPMVWCQHKEKDTIVSLFPKDMRISSVKCKTLSEGLDSLECELKKY